MKILIYIIKYFIWSYFMAKMEIELTEEQLKRVDILKENGIDVGEAIDMLFEFKNEILTQTDEYIDKRITEANKQKAELEAQINEIDEELSVIEKLKDNTLNVSEKQKILENEYGESGKSYEMKVQDTKHKIKWTREFFKF